MNKEYLRLIKVDFMHEVEEPWCNNQGVAILPYVLKNNEYHYLLTKEYNPLFNNKQISKYSTITGELKVIIIIKLLLTKCLKRLALMLKMKK